MNKSNKSLSLNRKIDLRLQRIANVLLLNASFIDNPGLLNGKMGITIFFYEYARYTGNRVFEDYAGELIDQIYEEINTNTPVDFENGLTGIGWGIEFLVKNGFVETNTNEVLADVDEAVYKSLLAGINFNDLEGFLLYIMSRIENESMKGHQKEDLKRNSLVLLLNEYAKFVALNNSKELIVSDKSTLISTIRNLIEEINKVGLCPEKIADIREILTPLNKMEDKEFKSEDKSVTEHAIDEIWQIISSTDIQKLSPETSTLFQALFNDIDSEENWKTTLGGINNDNAGINKRLAGIGFALLHIAMSHGLAGGKISNLDSPLTNHSGCLSLFIFKSSSRGMQYGMGTYINELTGALLIHTDINIFLVCYNSNESKEFSIETISERYFKIIIPAPIRSARQTTKSEERYGSVVVRFLSRIIPETGDIIFQMNYLDDLPIIMKLKEKYRNPVISMVHFAQWQQLFNGNKQKLKGLNIDKPTNNIEFTLSREKQMYALSDHLVSVTRYMKDFLINEYRIRPDKIDVIPNGLNLKGVKSVTPEEKQNIKKELGFGPKEVILLFTGRIDQCKGIFFLIEGFCEACKKSDDLRLVIIGQGEMQACLMRCTSYYGRITFTGFLSKDKLQEFYQIADIGIVPSVYDHCPYSVLEMIDFGIPLILSRIDGLNEILDEEKCLFINPEISETGEISLDKEDIAGLILSLSGDKKIRKWFSGEYRELIVKKFSGERMANEMNGLFKRLCTVTVEA